MSTAIDSKGHFGGSAFGNVGSVHLDIAAQTLNGTFVSGQATLYDQHAGWGFSGGTTAIRYPQPGTVAIDFVAPGGVSGTVMLTESGDGSGNQGSAAISISTGVSANGPVTSGYVNVVSPK